MFIMIFSYSIVFYKGCCWWWEWWWWEGFWGYMIYVFGDMDYFFMYNELFSRLNQCRIWVSNGFFLKFVKFMGYVIKWVIFVMYEKYFLKYSYMFSRCKC